VTGGSCVAGSEALYRGPMTKIATLHSTRRRFFAAVSAFDRI
jgi:hypothetical protein